MRNLAGKLSARMMAVFGVAAVTMLGLAGTAGAQPTLVLSPQLFDFNYVAIGSQSGPANFVIRNAGTGAATMGTVSLIGSAPQHYYVAAENCASRMLAPSASCTVSVRFRPEAAGNHMATLQVEADLGQTRLAYMLGSAKSLTGQGPPTGSLKPSARCLKAKKNLSLVRKKVRQTKRKLRAAGTKSRRQTIRKRLARQQREVRRLKAVVARRCGRANS